MKNQKLKKTVKPIPSFTHWVHGVNIYWLVIGPLLISLFVLSGFLVIGEKIYSRKPSEGYLAIVGAVCVLIGSASGVFQVIRREGPGPFGEPIYGLWPVVSGIILIVICWIIAICLLSYAFTFIAY